MWKSLGAGVGLRPPYMPIFLESHPPRSVEWFEEVTENLFPFPGEKKSIVLERVLKIRESLPIALHGVSLSLGGASPVSKDTLKNFKDLISLLEPEIVSDHLCWTGAKGNSLYDLLPLPYTKEALIHVTDQIKRVQDFLGRRILIENVSSYLTLEHSEYTEWNFISETLERADCGILLDINNIYVSAMNHGFDPDTYLDAIPFRRVGQIHLAGHVNKNWIRIDTHDQPIPEEVWELYENYTKKNGVMSTLVERDENFPPWEELEKEVKRIHAIQKKYAPKLARRVSKGDSLRDISL